MTAAYYVPSTRVTVLGVLAAGLAVGLVTPLLALIYAAAIVYIPIIYVNLLLTMVFGGAVGFAAAYALRLGHARGAAVTVPVVLMAGLVGYYLHWVFWFGVQFFRADGAFSDALLLLVPPLLVEDIGYVYDQGTWSIGRSSTEPVSGVLLGIVWALEALLYFGGLGVGAFAAAPGAYCERCSTWCTRHDAVAHFDAGYDPARFAARLDAGDLNPLAEAPRADPMADAWTRLNLECCESCGHTNVLVLESVTTSLDKQGQRSEKSERLVDRLLLTAEQAAWVRQQTG